MILRSSFYSSITLLQLIICSDTVSHINFFNTLHGHFDDIVIVNDTTPCALPQDQNAGKCRARHKQSKGQFQKQSKVCKCPTATAKRQSTSPVAVNKNLWPKIQITFHRKNSQSFFFFSFAFSSIFSQVTWDYMCSKLDEENDKVFLANLRGLTSGALTKLKVKEANDMITKILFICKRRVEFGWVTCFKVLLHKNS